MQHRHGSILALAALLAASLGAPIGQGQTPSAAPAVSNPTLIQGFIRFMAYHEAGHLLMNQVQGINASTWPKEDIERYADQFALILLVPDADDPTGVDEMVGAANAWLNAGAGHAANDPHAPPEERAYNIICYVYGSDPQNFAEFRQYVQPDWNCEAKFKTMEEEVEGGFLNNTGEAGARIQLTYAEPTANMRDARAFLQDAGILEDLVADIEGDFKLTRQTRLVAMSCKGHGDEGTFHFDTFQSDDPSKNFDRIAICYELVDMWMKTKLDL